MTCTPGCVKPTPTQAHCSVCHLTFAGVSGFDRHRRNGRCHSPGEIGYIADARGVYRKPIPDADRMRLAAMGRRGDADSRLPGTSQDGRNPGLVGRVRASGSDTAQTLSGGSR